jgi:protoporphyrinogen/coproporphyrinogen III oxidase
MAAGEGVAAAPKGTMTPRVLIAGGGIAGLSTAFELTRGGPGTIDVTVLERAARAGGNLHTERVDGYLCEWGPNGFLDNVPETPALVGELGIADRLLPADAGARRRFIYRNGHLHELPGGPVAFALSRLLSIAGRVRVLGELFAPPRPEADETIHAFAARRIGLEAADVLIDSMVSGIFAGNARELSLRACFPKMWEMEREHGSLVKAMLARRRERASSSAPMGAPGGHLTSFTGGVEELIHALVQALGPRVKTNCPVRRVRRRSSANPEGWLVELEDGRSFEADAVVLAGSASSSATLVEGFDGTLAAVLREIPTAPLAVVCLGYETARLDHPLDGFGFLVPRGEGIASLGALWDSSIYPGRAPQGRSLIRVMMGGAHDASAVMLDDEALIDRARADLETTMRLTIEPVFTRVFRHPAGIPQYTVGHLSRLATIEERIQRHPGLFLAGNSYRGVSINACIADAGPLANRVRQATAASARPVATLQ